MAINHSIILPVSMSVFASVVKLYPFSNVIQAAQRYFVTLDPVLNSYYSLSTLVTLSGDFEISLEFSSTTGGQMLIGDDFNTNYYFRTDSDGVFIVYSNGTLHEFSTASFLDGKLHKVVFKLTGTSLNCFLDNVPSTARTITKSTAANNFKIGTNSVFNRMFDGVIANVKINDLTQTGNTFTFALDNEVSDFELSKESTIGNENIINGDFSDGLNNWTVTENGQTVEVIGGRLHIITDGTSAGVQQTTAPADVAVKLSFNYTAVSGALKVQVGSESFTVNETGYYEFATTPSNSNVFLYRSSGAAEGYFDNVSIKQIQGNSLTYVGIPTTNRELFQFDTPNWDNISPAPQVLPATLEVA
jgi:hypothetical protein